MIIDKPVPVFFRSDLASILIHQYCINDKEFIDLYGYEGCGICEVDFTEYSYNRFCAYCLDKYNVRIVLNFDMEV